MLCIHDGYSPDDPIRNITMNNNIFFAREASQYNLCFVTPDNDISSFGTADNNGYVKPADNGKVVRTWSAGWSGSAIARSLDDWQSFSGQDNNSYESPVSFTDLNRIRFEYNASNSNKVVSLDGSYIDVKGNTYSGSITLAPYSSAILIFSSSLPPIVEAPIYISSEILNEAPDKIEMTYNVSLANIPPISLAFTILVNSNPVSVNNIAIIDTKVILTLSSAVVFGDVITISYTSPLSNPIQTPEGGIAESLTLKIVTNNVAIIDDIPVVVYEKIRIYPNPADEYFNVKIENSESIYNYIKIISVTGKIMYDKKLDPNIKEFRIPIDFKTGFYIIQMGFGNKTFFAQKLVIIKP
jgi:hypothetical protein